METQRRDFLLNRDGIKKTIEFYQQALECYKRAAERAVEPRKPNERRMIARGKEWAEKYLVAASECWMTLQYLRSL